MTNEQEAARLYISRRADGIYRVRFTITGGPVLAGTFALAAPTSRTRRLDTTTLSRILFADLGDQVAGYLRKHEIPLAVLVTIRAPELWTLPWEGIAAQWPLNLRPDRHYGVDRRIVRYSGYADRWALQPLTMPLSATYVGRTGVRSDTRRRFAKYYQAIERETTDGLGAALRAHQSDVVHLEFPVVSSGRREPTIAVGDHVGLGISTLVRSLHASATRLVILQGRPGSRQELLGVAHLIMGRNGPSVVVTEGSANFAAFYYDILHNQSLDDLVSWDIPGAVLLTTRYGTRALELERVATAMSADAQLSEVAVSTAAAVGATLELPVGSPDATYVALEQAQLSLARLGQSSIALIKRSTASCQ